MVHRNTPCAECRNHRRKCIRDSINNTCSRCSRLARNCITTEATETGLSYSESAKNVNGQIEYLNSTIADLENQINLLKSSNDNDNTFGNNNSNNDKTVAHYQDNDIFSGDWTLMIKNGRFRIETGIKNITDLLLHCPPVTFYPSFQTPTEKGLLVQFSPRKNLCVRALASKLLVKCGGANMEDNNKPMSFLSLPTSFLFDTKSVVDRLIHIYFQCHNTFNPFIHEPSFMRYYKQLNNPLDSLVCLCICCYVCGAPCKHIQHSFGDLTSIGKYLAGLSKLKLMDQFDLAEKRIENIISINLLSYYLHTLMLNNECKKLLTISYQIAVDLLPWYKNECEKESSSVEWAIYGRNVSLLITQQKSMRLPAESLSTLHQISCLPWKSMPDEPVELIDFIEARKWLAKLYNHPKLSKFKSQTREVLSGSVCSLPFEMIVGLDEVTNEWWRNLPERYKICDDWLDLEQCRASINQTTDGVTLVMFINFLIYMVSVYSLMLQPKSVEDNTVLSIVERLALNRSLHCCQIIMCGFERAHWLDIYSPCRYILVMKWHLIQIADVLTALSSSSNQTIKIEAKSMFESCISAIESMTFMTEHKVNHSMGPLLSKNQISLRELGDIDLSAYSTYPQPWYALIYDICRYLNHNSISRSILE